MRKIAHIINPVVVRETSDLFTAQPITFETMHIAREFAKEEVEVEFYTAQYPEDRSLIPEGFSSTPDLDRSILDFGTFEGNRKLPLIKDILERLYEATSAEYLVYTNVDIAVMPSFYSTLNLIIDQGFDAFAINRRAIPDYYNSVTELPLMYGEAGQRHPGHDCFIFRREAYPDFIVGKTCIGAIWIGRIMICNLAIHGKRFKEFTDKHLTFHIGNEPWQGAPIHADYVSFNEEQVQISLDHLEARFGPFSEHDQVFQYFSSFNDHKIRERVVRGFTKRSIWIRRLRNMLRIP